MKQVDNARVCKDFPARFVTSVGFAKVFFSVLKLSHP